MRAGHDFDADLWSVRGQIRFPFPFIPGLEMIPSGDVFSGEDGSDWQLNLDEALRPGPMLYAGGGLAIRERGLGFRTSARQ